MFCRRFFWAFFLFVFAAKTGWSASGTEGASFLDIPVGGAPAAMGSAYTALANDAYAPVWNPAGLGFLDSLEFTGMHMSYLGPIHYEHAGLVVPFGKESDDGQRSAGFGASAQYLGSGDLDGRDERGTSIGSFSTTFAAYSLAYGQRIEDHLSLGATAKLISEKIAGTSASAYAADLGLLFKPNQQFSLGAALANIGSAIKFVNESDPLPLAGRLGAAYQLSAQWGLSAEAMYRRTGLTSGGMGFEWRYGDVFAFRGGYNTSRIKELGAAAGLSAGAGLFFWGQEFSYAYVPVGDLGEVHYFSLVFRTHVTPRPDRPMLKKAAIEDYDEFKIEGSDKPESLNDFFSDRDFKTHD